MRVAKNGPELEAIDGPKEREKSVAELVKPPRVAHDSSSDNPNDPSMVGHTGMDDGSEFR